MTNYKEYNKKNKQVKIEKKWSRQIKTVNDKKKKIK